MSDASFTSPAVPAERRGSAPRLPLGRTVLERGCLPESCTSFLPGWALFTRYHCPADHLHNFRGFVQRFISSHGFFWVRSRVCLRPEGDCNWHRSDSGLTPMPAVGSVR